MKGLFDFIDFWLYRLFDFIGPLKLNVNAMSLMQTQKYLTYNDFALSGSNNIPKPFTAISFWINAFSFS